MSETIIQRISIRPKTTMLSVLKHLEYETWFALAEFVDNSIASFKKNESQLKELEGEDLKLSVKIEIDEINRKITIRDNAAGIHEKDYQRAFLAAEVPPDNTGLAEFGMGMKTASIWLAESWTVRTKSINESIERSVAKVSRH